MLSVWLVNMPICTLVSFQVMLCYALDPVSELQSCMSWNFLPDPSLHPQNINPCCTHRILRNLSAFALHIMQTFHPQRFQTISAPPCTFSVPNLHLSLCIWKQLKINAMCFIASGNVFSGSFKRIFLGLMKSIFTRSLEELQTNLVWKANAVLL